MPQRQTFTAGQVLTAAQMTLLQENIWIDDVNTQTDTTYTLVLTDAGKQVTMSNASASTLTVPANASVAFVIGTRISVINLGVGTVTLVGDGAATLTNSSNDFTITQYGVAILIKVGTNSWVVQRNFDQEDDQNILSNRIFG